MIYHSLPKNGVLDVSINQPASHIRLLGGGKIQKAIVQRFIYQTKSKQMMMPVQTNAKGKISYFLTVVIPVYIDFLHFIQDNK
jgi:hypothetical protein